MYLHFQNWTSPMFLKRIEEKGTPHGGKIFKVYASLENPRELLKKNSLLVLESDHSPFSSSEVFAYEGRESYNGSGLEEELSRLDLNDKDKQTVRALFRFANKEGFCQAAMSAKTPEGLWFINHPFDDLHIPRSSTDSWLPIPSSHLDIFFPSSLKKIEGIIQNETEQVLSFREVMDLRRRTVEGRRGRTVEG